MGPCLCGDAYCPSCSPGSSEPPEECPVCGKANYYESSGEMKDNKHFTCGKKKCLKEAQKRAKNLDEGDAMAAEIEDEYSSLLESGTR